MRKENRLARRGFLRTLGAGAAAALAAPWMLESQGQAATAAAVSPGEMLTVGVIGCGGMGALHMASLLKRGDVNIAAVCDVNAPRFEGWKSQIGGRCAGFQDFRRVLERKDIDAVFVAPPDHWHALIAILACQAGKDVYIEKPMTTTVEEGRKVVDAARRYGRVVQVGLQQRSMEAFQRAKEIVRSGRLGQLLRAAAWGGVSGVTPPERAEAPPAGLDWDMWLGPAPWAPYSPQRYGAFRAFRDYAGGELTNWGVHVIDSGLASMDQNAPRSIQALAVSTDSAERDDHEIIDILYEFDGLPLTWTQGSRVPQHAGRVVGTLFEGTAGRLTVDRSGYVVEPQSLGIEEFRSPGDFFIQLDGHHDDFFSCIRTRQRPRADCETAHRSTTMCLLGNIAIECKRKLYWDGQAERFVGDDQANRHLGRAYRPPWHLA